MIVKIRRVKNGILSLSLIGLFSSFSMGTLYAADKENSYTDGVFIVNEDWFGHQNSTVNWLSSAGEWTYRAFQKANSGKELGATTQYGTIYGDKFYLMSKQEKDQGATITGGRITVCDAKTLKCLKQIPVISTNKEGFSNADGRAFLGVDLHKGYVSTSNGIYIYDMDKMEVGAQVKGTGNPNTDPYGSLYKGQVGSMVRVNDRVFAVHQSSGLMVIDAQGDSLLKVIQPPFERDSLRGYGSVVLSKDGNLWLSMARDQTGRGTTLPYLIKVNPVSLDTVRVLLPKDIVSPSNSWYAWTPDAFCASTQHNCLYWGGGYDSWFTGMQVVKYDIDENRFVRLIDFSSTGWRIYGASFRVHPVTDELYMSLYHDVQDPTYVVHRYSNEGILLDEYPMITNYWFPSLPVFPDTEAPVVKEMDKVIVNGAEVLRVSLTGMVSDPDNMEAAIVKSVARISDESVLTATVVDGNLNLFPHKTGDAEVFISFNSNGKVVEGLLPVSVSGISGLEENELSLQDVYYRDRRLYVNHSEGSECILYKEDGSFVNSYRIDQSGFSVSLDCPSGIYILKMMKGTKICVRKILVQ